MPTDEPMNDSIASDSDDSDSERGSRSDDDDSDYESVSQESSLEESDSSSDEEEDGEKRAAPKERTYSRNHVRAGLRMILATLLLTGESLSPAAAAATLKHPKMEKTVRRPRTALPRASRSAALHSCAPRPVRPRTCFD
jgi:hypothetical protein